MTSLCPPTRCGNVFTFPHPLQLPGRRDSNLPKAQRTTLGQGHFSFLILSLLPSSPLLFPNHPSSSSLPSSPLSPLSSSALLSFPFVYFSVLSPPHHVSPLLSSVFISFSSMYFPLLSSSLNPLLLPPFLPSLFIRSFVPS